MRTVVTISVALQILIFMVIWTSTPRVMAVDLYGGEGGVYTSEVFRVPLKISDATFDISVFMDTYLRIWLEIRAGDNYVRFHLNNASISYHFQNDILDFFGHLSHRDVKLTAVVDTDGIVQGVPQVSITYYGFW